MDHNDIKGYETPNPCQQDLSGKTKSFSDCCGAYPSADTGLEKHGHDSDHEINSSKSEDLPAMQRKSSSYDNISTISSISESGNHSKTQSLIFSVARSRQIGNGDLKSGNLSRDSAKQNISLENICTKSDVSSETEEPLNKDSNNLLHQRMNTYCPSADEEKIGNAIKETYHDKQHKTESCSSNSTLTNLPASSYDSFQEMSVGPKKCEHDTPSGMDSSQFTDFNCRVEECMPINAASLGTSKDVPDMTVASAGKQVTNGEPLEIVDNVRPVHCGKISRVSVDRDSVNTEMSDITKIDMSMLKLPNEDEKESCSEVDNAEKVAQKVSREVEQEDEKCEAGSGCILSAEEGMEGMVNVCSVDFVNRNERDGQIETRRKSFTEQNECLSSSSVKAVDAIDIGFQKQESSCPLKFKDAVADEQTTQARRIDLNELVNEACHSRQLVKENLSKPIPVLHKVNIPKYGWRPQFEGKIGGWKGASATGAFLPISHFKHLNRNMVSPARHDNDSKDLPLKGIDLNVAVAEEDFEMDILSQKCSPASSSLHSGTCLQAERVCIDLNSVGENEENTSQPSPSQSLSGHVVRDFDLNDQPMLVDEYSDAGRQGQGNLAFQRRAHDDPALSFQGRAGQLNYNNVGSQCFADLPSFPSLDQTSFVHSAEQMQMVVALQHKPTYNSVSTMLPQPPPPQTLTYNNGFFIDHNNRLFSAPYAPGIIPCVGDSSAVFPQMFNSGVHSAYNGLPHLMKVPSVIRPNFDVNGGMACSDNVSRGENGRQWFGSVSKASTDEQLKSVQQASSSAIPLKRQEPEGGWDSNQVGYRRFTSWH